MRLFHTPSNEADALALVEIYKYMEATRFGVLHVLDAYGIGFVQVLSEASTSAKIDMKASAFHKFADASTIRDAVAALKETKFIFFVGNPNTWKVVVRAALDVGMIGGEGYFWIFSEFASLLTGKSCELDRALEKDIAEAIDGSGILMINAGDDGFTMSQNLLRLESSLKFTGDSEFLRNYINIHTVSCLWY